MPEATPRLDYIPFKVTTKKNDNRPERERLQLNSSSDFFITFHVYGNNTVYFEAFAAV